LIVGATTMAPAVAADDRWYETPTIVPGHCATYEVTPSATLLELVAPSSTFIAAALWLLATASWVSRNFSRRTGGSCRLGPVMLSAMALPRARAPSRRSYSDTPSGADGSRVLGPRAWVYCRARRGRPPRLR